MSILGNKAAGSIHPDSLTVSIAYDNSIILNSIRKFVDVELCSDARGLC